MTFRIIHNDPTATFTATGTTGTGSTSTLHLSSVLTQRYGSVGINQETPARTLHVTGEARITDLTTDTPTRIVGADADGDLGAITVGSGLSLSNDTLNVSASLLAPYLLDADTTAMLAPYAQGSGTANFFPIWTGTRTLGRSILQQPDTNHVSLSTKALRLGSWTTAGRPATPAAGYVGFNSTLTQPEMFDGTSWHSWIKNNTATNFLPYWSGTQWESSPFVRQSSTVVNMGNYTSGISGTYTGPVLHVGNTGSGGGPESAVVIGGYNQPTLQFRAHGGWNVMSLKLGGVNSSWQFVQESGGGGDLDLDFLSSPRITISNHTSTRGLLLGNQGVNGTMNNIYSSGVGENQGLVFRLFRENTSGQDDDKQYQMSWTGQVTSSSIAYAMLGFRTDSTKLDVPLTRVLPPVFLSYKANAFPTTSDAFARISEKTFSIVADTINITDSLKIGGDNIATARLDVDGTARIRNLPARTRVVGHDANGVLGTVSYQTLADSVSALIGGGGSVNGSGTANYIAKWSATDTITDSNIYADGTNVGINTTTPVADLDVRGRKVNITGSITGTGIIGNTISNIASISDISQVDALDYYGKVYHAVGNHQFGHYDYILKSRTVDGNTRAAVRPNDDIYTRQFIGDNGSIPITYAEENITIVDTSATSASANMYIDVRSGSRVGGLSIMGGTGKLGIWNKEPDYSISFDTLTSDGIGIPGGTTAQRPAVALRSGYPLRYNTEISAMEYSDGSNWKSISEGRTGHISADTVDVDLSSYLSTDWLSTYSHVNCWIRVDSAQSKTITFPTPSSSYAGKIVEIVVTPMHSSASLTIESSTEAIWSSGQSAGVNSFSAAGLGYAKVYCAQEPRTGAYKWIIMNYSLIP